jgi:hypothetical protein
LHFAVREDLNEPLYRLILKKGADPTLADRHGVTPIRKARLLGFEALALEMEKKAGKAEPFEFTPAIHTSGPWTLEEAAFLASLPVSLIRGHFPDKGFLPKPAARNASKNELTESFGIRSAADLKSFYKNNGHFEPCFPEKLGQPPFLLEALEWVSPNNPDERPSLQAWTVANQLHVLRLGREAGYLKAEEVEPLLEETLGGLRKNFFSWRSFVVSFLAGAAKHRGWEFERYSSVCRRLVEDNPESTPWTDTFWKESPGK